MRRPYLAPPAPIIPPHTTADETSTFCRLTFDRLRATLGRMTVASREDLATMQRATELTLRLGVAYPGDPDDPSTWSGTPASLAGALRQHGASVTPLLAEAPRLVTWIAAQLLTAVRVHRTPGPTMHGRLRVSRTIALYTGREMSSLRTRALRRHVAKALPLDAVVQIGTGYALPPGLRIATFEDMTVRQALSLPYPEWQGLSPAEQEAAVGRQAHAYSHAVACCFSTRWAANSAIDDYGVPPEKAHVVGVGRNHSPRPVPRDWETPRFLFVGGDWVRKNGDAVVRAFGDVRRHFPTARLDLVGSHPRVDVQGVTGHGWLSLGRDEERERLDRLFEAATCFVMPSWCEPSAISYLEAGSAGVASIGSTVGGSAELIGDGGCVVDPSDDAALLEAMLEFSRAEAAREAGARALARADDFTWPQVASRILAAIETSGA